MVSGGLKGPYGPYCAAGTPQTTRQQPERRSSPMTELQPSAGQDTSRSLASSRGCGIEMVSPLSRSVMDMHGTSKSGRYSRLAGDEHARQTEISQSSFKSLQRSLSNPNSSYQSATPAPSLTPQERKAMGDEWKPQTFVDRPGINSRFYPHPSHLRGEKRLTKIAVVSRGLDPLKDKAHVVDDWDAPLNRFERNSKIHGALVGGNADGGTRAPQHTEHWRSQEAFAQPGLYEKPWKINHAWPVRTSKGGVGSDIRVRPPGEEIEARRQRSEGPFWPAPPR